MIATLQRDNVVMTGIVRRDRLVKNILANWRVPFEL
jgi:hypothetical protein